MTTTRLADHFLEYFSVIPATSPALRDQTFAIRYEVYCREFGYEAAANFPDGRERDDYDTQARHLLVQHRSSGLMAGCVRVVPTLLHEPTALLPFEHHCYSSLYHDHLASLDLNRANICEISRLAVIADFRRRAGESESPCGRTSTLSLGDVEHRTFPLIGVALYLAVIALTRRAGWHNLFAMMEPFLPRLLRRYGIFFEPVGSEVDYHGRRAAYLVTTDSLLANMKPELKGLYQAIRDNDTMAEFLERLAA